MASFNWRVMEAVQGRRAVTRVQVAGGNGKKDYAAKVRLVGNATAHRHYHLSVEWIMLNASLPTESFEAALDIANKILDAWGFEPVKEDKE